MPLEKERKAEEWQSQAHNDLLSLKKLPFLAARHIVAPLMSYSGEDTSSIAIAVPKVLPVRKVIQHILDKPSNTKEMPIRATSGAPAQGRFDLRNPQNSRK